MGKTNFWNGKLITANAEESDREEEKNEDLPEDENIIRKSYEDSFRQMGLTRQQSVVATFLALKKEDATICAELNISPNTLKTHVRNILHKLTLSSRYELPWLISKSYHPPKR